MMTIAVILAIWVVLSVPLSVILGHSMSAPEESELLGMEGDVAVFRRANGCIERVSLTTRTSA
jgi:hypothetical protein